MEVINNYKQLEKMPKMRQCFIIFGEGGILLLMVHNLNYSIFFNYFVTIGYITSS